MRIAFVIGWFFILSNVVLAKDLNVLAPKTVRGIVMEISNFYEKKNPDWDVKVRTGGSQELSNLIVQGTPADVFFLSDDKAVQLLKDKQLTTDAKPYLADDLVVVALATSKLQIDNPSKLAFPELKGVALLEEDDPIGKSTRDYLRKIDIFNSIQNKIGIQENAKAIRKSLEDGITDWGILYQSDVNDVPTLKVLYKIPERDNTPHFYYLGTVTKSTEKEAARNFISAVRSSIIQKFFENAGFRIVR